MLIKNKFIAVTVGLYLVATPSAVLRADLDDEETPSNIATPQPINPPLERPTPPPPAKSAPPKASPATSGKQTPAKKSGTSNNVKKTRTTPGEGDERKQPVTFKSKGLRATKEKGVMELSEDVVVTQGDLQLKANHAKVYYNDTRDEVSKVVVTGNVKINKSSQDPKERITGVGNEGVFYNSERKVILRGNAQLIRGDDVLRGKQITYELDTGWISVDNVEGVMQPGDKK